MFLINVIRFSISLMHVYFLLVVNRPNLEFEKTLYQRSTCTTAFLQLFVSFVVGQVRGGPNNSGIGINLLPSIGCPRHCRDARGFFILRPPLLLHRRLASIRFLDKKRKAIALVNSSPR